MPVTLIRIAQAAIFFIALATASLAPAPNTSVPTWTPFLLTMNVFGAVAATNAWAKDLDSSKTISWEAV
jgi:hypothetical protein